MADRYAAAIVTANDTGNFETPWPRWLGKPWHVDREEGSLCPMDPDTRGLGHDGATG